MAFAVKGDPSLEEHQQADRVNETFPQSNFVLAHDPSDWTMTATGHLIPTLKQLAKHSGANGYNGHEDPTRDRQRWEAALSEHRNNGFVIIRSRDLMELNGYVRAYETSRGRTTHRTVLQQPISRGPKAAIKWKVDPDDLVQFCRLLEIKGLIQPPRPYVIRELLAQVDKELGSARQHMARAGEGRAGFFQEQLTALQTRRAMLLNRLAASRDHYGSDEGSIAKSERKSTLQAAIAAAKGKKAAVNGHAAGLQPPAPVVTPERAPAPAPPPALIGEQPEPADPPAPLSLDALNLPAPAREYIQEVGLTLEDLKAFTEDNWRDLPRIGRARAASIMEVIHG